MTDPRIPDDDPRLREAISRLPDAIEPPRDLWPDIRAEFEKDRVRALPSAADVGAAAAGSPGADRARWKFGSPALAAAAVVLIVATAGVTWWLKPGGTPAPDTASAPAVTAPETFARFASYERSAAELTAALDQKAVTLDPATKAVLERSLRTIDEALTEARNALERDPASADISAYVESAYRHKIDFLRRANDVAALRGI